MTYIDYINRFNQWLESNALPPSAQLMYYKLLHVFNRAGWPPTVQVDNHRLMVMAGVAAESTVIQLRKKLIKAGLIQYKSGKKGIPNRYSLCEIALYNQSTNASINTSTNASINTSVSTSTNASHIKNKKNNKTETFPPNPPRGASMTGHPKAYDIAELERLSVLKLPENL